MGKTLNIGGVLGNWEIMGPNLNKLVFDRCRYLLMKPKKKKFQKDFGHFILSLPDKPIPRQDFDLLLKKKKIKKLDKDLIDELTSKFVLKKKIDCVELTKAYMELYPNTTLPVVEKKPKKGRRKKKEKVVDIEKELATVDLDGGQQENAEKTPVDLKVGSQSVATKEKLPSLDEGKMGEKGESLPKIAIEGGGNEGIEKRFIEDEGIEKVFFDDEGVEESSTEDEGVEKIGLEGVGIAN
ncbi:hypothetical protein JTB14_000739 [Gonioctena quinquepunctata]|nr:hypothetical protein JTB14_000739 [Gonioctena quinquepunctata]